MEKPFIFNFDELLQLDQLYVPEEYFYQPFYDFDSRINSLYRYFYINQKTANQFLIESKASYVISRAKESDAMLDIAHSDITLPDVEYHLNFLYSSVLTQLFSIFENVLIEAIDLVRADLKISDEIPKAGPITDCYVTWLNRFAGCEVRFDTNTYATLDVLRNIRNSFVHANIKKTPVQMLNKLKEIKDKSVKQGYQEQEGYVLEAFSVISNAVKVVEVGVIQRVQQASRF
jgi:hypothetical protein